MRNYITSRSNVWIGFICAILIISLSTAAYSGALSLLYAGSPGSGGGGGCTNSLDFSQACNSQYIPII